MHSSLIVRWIGNAVLPALLAAAAFAGDPAGPDSRGQVLSWVKQLDADSYQLREKATLSLAKAGKPAVEPLASAATAASPEVVSRAVDILSRLASSGDPEAEDAAELALESIVERQGASPSHRAATALQIHRELRQERAVTAIQQLGGAVALNQYPGIEESRLQVILGADWKGEAKDLVLLKRMPDLVGLSLRGAPIADDSLEHLKKLRSLKALEVYGTSLSDAAIKKLSEALPDVTIDRRNGALLGVSGSSGAQIGCSVVMVQPGSAAEEADLRSGDLIVSFAGKKVADFHDLTSMVGSYKGGEKVDVQLVRSGKLVTKQVVLGSWRR